MVAIELPEYPTDIEFEEFISAFFNIGGYYIERNLIEKDVEQVLELDIISTNYNETPPGLLLIEVKSGGWGFPDIFKLRGWMDYLNLEKGALIAHKEKRNIDFLKQRGRSLAIQVIIISDFNKADKSLHTILKYKKIEDFDLTMWRYSYWVERNLLKRLKEKKIANPDLMCYQIIDDYLFEVNSGIFFTENIVEKLMRLYSAYRRYPHISARCGNELIGDDFEAYCTEIPTEIFKDTFYKCSYTDIQLSTFVEHRARLAILKNAIDYLIYSKAGIKNKIEDKSCLTFEGPDFSYQSTSFDYLPSTFKKGLEKISSHKYYYKYPVFWQWFTWVFGGFILKDYKKEDFQLLSEKTGIPIEEIPNALRSYQLLFPIQGGWFLELANSNIIVMKMFPIPFMGIGANFRRLYYSTNHDYHDLKLKGMHTLRDLGKWNNLTLKVLREEVS